MPLPRLSHPTAILLIEPAVGLAVRLQDALLGQYPAALDVGLARSLREAMHHACAHHVDLVLLDMTLPDYKGTDAVRALRMTVPSCALVAFSATSEDRILLDALQAGAHEVFSAASFPLTALRGLMERAMIRAAGTKPGAAWASCHPSPAASTAGIVHDLNNALTSINGFAEMLVSRLPAEDPARAAAAQIRQAGARAASLVKALAPQNAAASQAAAAPITQAA